MRQLKVAATPDTISAFRCRREVVDFEKCDLAEVSVPTFLCFGLSFPAEPLSCRGFA